MPLCHDLVFGTGVVRSVVPTLVPTFGPYGFGSAVVPGIVDTFVSVPAVVTTPVTTTTTSQNNWSGQSHTVVDDPRSPFVHVSHMNGSATCDVWGRPLLMSRARYAQFCRSGPRDRTRTSSYTNYWGETVSSTRHEYSDWWGHGWTSYEPTTTTTTVAAVTATESSDADADADDSGSD